MNTSEYSKIKGIIQNHQQKYSNFLMFEMIVTLLIFVASAIFDFPLSMICAIVFLWLVVVNPLVFDHNKMLLNFDLSKALAESTPNKDVIDIKSKNALAMAQSKLNGQDNEILRLTNKIKSTEEKNKVLQEALYQQMNKSVTKEKDYVVAHKIKFM